jgi:hypothetical protein
MPKAQKQSLLAVGGIQLNVFSPILDPGKAVGQVAVLFLLHGRLSKADVLEATAAKLVEKSEDRRSASDGTALELVVVTFVSSTITVDKHDNQSHRSLGFEESRPQNNQPSGKPTMEPQCGGKQPSTCVSTQCLR